MVGLELVVFCECSFARFGLLLGRPSHGKFFFVQISLRSPWRFRQKFLGFLKLWGCRPDPVMSNTLAIWDLLLDWFFMIFLSEPHEL